MDTLNATANRELIAAIRIAYRVARLLPLEVSAGCVRFVARAWREASRADVFAGLWAIGEELRTVDGADRQLEELTAAVRLAVVEQRRLG